MLKIRKEGIIYIIINGLIITLFFLLGLKYLNFIFHIFSGLMLIPAFFIAYFFRDPERTPESNDPGDYISPADGEIIVIDEINEEQMLKTKVRKISIFMNVLSVHVNRSPVKGKIKKIVYHPGLFLPAFKNLASVKNERVDFLISGNICTTRVSLISGIIARRIVSFSQTNQGIEKGERIGMIKFGSRVDCYLPLDFQVKVKLGDKVFSGQTVIAFK